MISRTIAEEEGVNVVLSLGGDVAIARGDRSADVVADRDP